MVFNRDAMIKQEKAERQERMVKWQVWEEFACHFNFLLLLHMTLFAFGLTAKLSPKA
jgi:hypothetical protein